MGVSAVEPATGPPGIHTTTLVHLSSRPSLVVLWRRWFPCRAQPLNVVRRWEKVAVGVVSKVGGASLGSRLERKAHALSSTSRPGALSAATPTCSAGRSRSWRSPIPRPPHPSRQFWRASMGRLFGGVVPTGPRCSARRPRGSWAPQLRGGAWTLGRERTGRFTFQRMAALPSRCCAYFAWAGFPLGLTGSRSLSSLGNSSQSSWRDSQTRLACA